MSTLINVLEQLASDASISNSVLKTQLIEQSDLTLDVKQALINGDTSKIEAALSPITCIAIYPAEDEPAEVPVKEQPVDEPSQDQPSGYLIAHG